MRESECALGVYASVRASACACVVVCVCMLAHTRVVLLIMCVQVFVYESKCLSEWAVVRVERESVRADVSA